MKQYSHTQMFIRKNLVCVLSLGVGIAIEEGKTNMCFTNDMQTLNTLYLSNGKQIKKKVLHLWY